MEEISRTLTKEEVENTPGGTLKSIKIDSLKRGKSQRERSKENNETEITSC